jgi:hypothetical protein
MALFFDALHVLAVDINLVISEQAFIADMDVGPDESTGEQMLHLSGTFAAV